MLGGCWEECDILCFHLEYTPVPRSPEKRTHKRCRGSRSDVPIFMKSIELLREHCIEPLYLDMQTMRQNLVSIPWDSMPSSSKPAGGGLPSNRIYRKTIQVENMMRLAIDIISQLMCAEITRSIVVVEFCAGSGFVCIPLAVLYPQVQFILLDKKSASLQIAKKRVNEAKLSNVNIIEQNISDFDEDFDVGIALHACGFASDLSLQKCVKRQATFIICPCCIGKVLFDRKNPLSQKFNDILSKDLFCHLIKSADFGHSSEERAHHSVENVANRRQSKQYIEEDRRHYALESGYNAFITTMWPHGASPKDDILVGWPESIIISRGP